MNRYLILCICAALVQNALGQEGAAAEAETPAQQQTASQPASPNVMMPQPAQISGPYGPYAGMYGQMPMSRPAWPYPKPVGGPVQGPVYSGYNPGAVGGWNTLPLMANNAPQQQEFAAPVGRSAPIGRSMYPQRAARPYGQEWNSAPQPQQQLRPYPSPNNQHWLSPSGSVPASASGVEEVSQPQPQYQPQWNAAPSYGRQNMFFNQWQPAPQPQYQQRPIWQQPQAQMGQWMPAPVEQEEKEGEEEAEDVTTPAVATNGWTPGLPSWRRSYTPIPGQNGCFNRCKPSCSRPLYGGGYGCQPSCRNRCNVRPSCGRRGNVNWAGNTMVCGRNNNNWGAQINNNNPWAYNQPQYGQYGMPVAAQAAAAPAQAEEEAEDAEEA